MAGLEPDTPSCDSDFPSGEWVGFYVDHGSNHRQEMHLSFADGRMQGAGADAVGPFVIRGTYDPESKDVRWVKTYSGQHSVYYKGYREVKGIWGMWEIPPGATDGFHIWPRAHGEAPSVRTAAERDAPVTVGVPQPV